MSISTPSAPAFPAGWYPNPTGPGSRYYDGIQWTDGYSPDLPSAEPERAGGLVALGYITALLMPLIGFILGIVVATRPAKVTSKHGAVIILLSIIAFVAYVAIIMHGTSQTITVPTNGS